MYYKAHSAEGRGYVTDPTAVEIEEVYETYVKKREHYTSKEKMHQQSGEDAMMCE